MAKPIQDIARDVRTSTLTMTSNTRDQLGHMERFDQRNDEDNEDFDDAATYAAMSTSNLTSSACTAFSRSSAASVIVSSKDGQPSVELELPSDEDEYEQPVYGRQDTLIPGDSGRSRERLRRRGCEADSCFGKEGREYAHIVYEDEIGGLTSDGLRGTMAAGKMVSGEQEVDITRGIPLHICEDCHLYTLGWHSDNETNIAGLGIRRNMHIDDTLILSLIHI